MSNATLCDYCEKRWAVGEAWKTIEKRTSVGMVMKKYDLCSWDCVSSFALREMASNGEVRRSD